MAGLGMLPGPGSVGDGRARAQEPESIRDVSPARLRLAVLLTIILLWLAASWYAIEVRMQLRVHRYSNPFEWRRSRVASPWFSSLDG